MNLNRGTFLSGRIDYLQLTVVESTTGHEVWRINQYPPANAEVPDYGDRSQDRFIVWAPDSSSVTIPVVNGQKITLPIP